MNWWWFLRQDGWPELDQGSVAEPRDPLSRSWLLPGGRGCSGVRQEVGVGEGTGPWLLGGKLRGSRCLPIELLCVRSPSSSFPLRLFNCQGPALESGGGSFSHPPPPRCGRNRKDSARCWGSSGPGGGLWAGVSDCLELCSGKRALVGSRLWHSLLWPWRPRRPGGHAPGLQYV